MDIHERMARLAQTEAFQALLAVAVVEGPQELSEEATMLLAGILCVDCRVRLKVEVLAGLPGVVGVEVLHDTACPTWQTLVRAERASEN